MNTEIFQGKTLLIVDDERDLRRPLVAGFESLGCRVFEASNGNEGLLIVKRENIDAVISDIRMPGGDGIEFLCRIKEIHHAFPVVMLITGYADLSPQQAYDMGAEAILTKPFDLDAIEEAVFRILRTREDRWSSPIAQDKIKRLIDRGFSELDESLKNGSLRLGRGGFFIQMDDPFPFLGEMVGFQIRFSNGNLLLIEGAGTVRWIRREDAPDLPKGCGIEFESLSDEARGKIIEFTECARIVSFIPKA